MLWLKHLKEEESRREFEGLVLAANGPLSRLKTILAEKKKEMKGADYSDASWAYRQAHENGYNEALSDIAAILPLTKE